jgi:hypothetical protein
LDHHSLGTSASHASDTHEPLPPMSVHPTGSHLLGTISVLPNVHFLLRKNTNLHSRDIHVLDTISVRPNEHFLLQMRMYLNSMDSHVLDTISILPMDHSLPHHYTRFRTRDIHFLDTILIYFNIFKSPLLAAAKHTLESHGQPCCRHHSNTCK